MAKQSIKTEFLAKAANECYRKTEMSSQSSLQPAPVSLPAKPFRLPSMQELGLVIVVLILGAVLATYGWHDARPGHPNTFLNFDNLVDGIATPMSYYAIMAIGQTFVIITAGIDISVGSIMALSALGSAAVLMRLPAEFPIALVVAMAVVVPLLIGLVCGLINGGLIVSLNLHPFIVTLGTMSIFRGLANVLPWFHTKTLVVPPPDGRVHEITDRGRSKRCH